MKRGSRATGFRCDGRVVGAEASGDLAGRRSAVAAAHAACARQLVRRRRGVERDGLARHAVQGCGQAMPVRVQRCRVSGLPGRAGRANQRSGRRGLAQPRAGGAGDHAGLPVAAVRRRASWHVEKTRQDNADVSRAPVDLVAAYCAPRRMRANRCVGALRAGTPSCCWC